MLSVIAENLKRVNSRIETAAKRRAERSGSLPAGESGASPKGAGRDAHDIILVAVTKTVPVETIEEAISLGIKDIGENRIQEAGPKIKTLGNKARWHMIGHLQGNKAKDAVEFFDLIHSVDSFKLAEEISRRATAKGRVQDILIEVKTSSEATKYGIKPDGVLSLVKDIAGLPNVKIKGLMTMAPLADNPEKARPYFRRCRELYEEIDRANIGGIKMNRLSMGMSDDFEVAIEEGSNIVRIGRAIFG